MKRKINQIVCKDNDYSRIYTNQPQGLKGVGKFGTIVSNTGMSSVEEVCRICPLGECYLVVPYSEFREPLLLFPREISYITFTK